MCADIWLDPGTSLRGLGTMVWKAMLFAHHLWPRMSAPPASIYETMAGWWTGSQDSLRNFTTLDPYSYNNLKIIPKGLQDGLEIEMFVVQAWHEFGPQNWCNDEGRETDSTKLSSDLHMCAVVCMNAPNNNTLNTIIGLKKLLSG